MLVHFLLQPPPSQERQEAGGPVLAEQEDSALGNTPKTPAGECSSPSSPSSVCENLYQSRCATAGARLHVRIISQARKWWRGRAPRNHACGNARRWEKLYHQTLTNAFLKKLQRDCQCLDFVLEVPVSVVPSFRVSDLVRYYVGI